MKENNRITYFPLMIHDFTFNKNEKLLIWHIFPNLVIYYLNSKIQSMDIMLQLFFSKAAKYYINLI